jgi:poly(ADP-ribose) glycohydrolase ARH3
MTESLDLETKIVGGLIGTGVGDAIGEMAFRYPHKESLLSAVERREEIVYTDDTAMALGLAESIVAVGGLDQRHLGDTFRDNYRREPWRGYASGPPTVFSQVERQDIAYAEAARTLYGGEGSFGNGAAMRVAPVGLFFHDADDLYGRARRSATLTHAHPIGVDGAAVQARAVAQAVSLDPREPFQAEDFLQTLIDTARTSQMRDKLKRVRDVTREDVPPREAVRVLGQGVAVHRSLPFALYAFVGHPKVFQDCLFCAALNGGDRDTMAAMACAISGTYLGVEAVPAAWRDKLENRDYIERLARQLAEMRATSPTATGAE